MNRPTELTQSIADDICAKLANGIGLTTICRPKHMPTRHSVQRWLAHDLEFRSNYARARDLQADFYAEKVLAIAMKSTNETAMADRLKMDALKWTAGKMAPKRYGTEKQEVEHTGALTLIDLVAESYKPKTKPDLDE